MTSNRIKNFKDFSGQPKVVKSLLITLEAARQKKTTPEHVLFYGPPGLGKTSLAYIIANDLGTNLKTVTGPSLTRAGDLASILTNLEEGDVLFIDEIHRLNKTVEEALYSAMEDFVLDIILGKGPAARPLRLEINPFTLIGATTRVGMLSKPLRDRFGLIHRLRFYKPETLTNILIQDAGKQNIKLDDETANTIASRSRGTPRIALKLLRRVLDFCQVEHRSAPTPELTQKALDFYQVDEAGLDETDRHMLETIIKEHKGGPVGLETLSAIISEDKETIKEVYEPFLLQEGFLTRTPRGRVVTPKAYRHLRIDYNNFKNNSP